MLSAVSGLHAAALQMANAQTAVDSYNWSGYAVLTQPASRKVPATAVTAVSGSWKVPAVSDPGTSTAYAAVWVGIDGYSSSTVEQTGTLSYVSVSNGMTTVTNYAWYEMYPNPMYEIPSPAIRSIPGTRLPPVSPIRRRIRSG